MPEGGAYAGNTYGQWIFETAGKYMESEAEYTADGNYLTKITGSDGSSTSYNYNTTKGTLTSVTEPGGITTGYTYAASNDQLTGVSRSGSSVSYGYSRRQLKTIVSPNGTRYTFNYNGFSQCTSVTAGGRTLSTNTYDSLGRLTGTTYGNGATVTKTYDKMSRVKSVSLNGTEKVSYTYDNDGNISRTDDKSSGIESCFKYDSIRRLVSMKTSTGYSLKLSYDDKNRIGSISENTGSGERITEYRYGSTGIVGSVKATYGNSTIYSSYTYDSLMRACDSYVEIDGDEMVCYEWSYRDGKNAGSTTSLVSGLYVNEKNYGYEYDERGNITRITKNGTAEAEYTYDALDRLIKETRNGTTTSWTYDANGNILTRTSKGGNAGEAAAGTTVTYEYKDSSWKDLLTKYNGQSITYDAIGNPLTWGNRTFTWTAGRRLSSVNMPGKTISYTYGADGYRTSKTVNGVTTTYILDGGRISALKRGSDELLFVYDENGDVTGFYWNGAPYAYVKNLQGDVTGIVNKSGAWVVSYEYDAWGKLLSTTGTEAAMIGVLNPFRYRSYNYDEETGLYYLNSRLFAYRKNCIYCKNFLHIHMFLCYNINKLFV